MFRIAYCQPFLESSYSKCKNIREEFVQTAYEHFPEFKKKVKIHLILHLPEHMLDFGPTSALNTERYIHVHYIYTCISPYYTVHILCIGVRLSTLSFEHKTSLETEWLQAVI